MKWINKKHSDNARVGRPIRWHMVGPMWLMTVLILISVFFISQFIIVRYIQASIQNELSSIGVAAKEIIESEYVFNEHLGVFQRESDIYPLAKRLLKRLNELPRRILTSDYDVRFLIQTDEMLLHFVTVEGSDEEEQSDLANKIWEEMNLSNEDQSAEERIEEVTKILYIGEDVYCATSIPLQLRQLTGDETGTLITYVNVSFQKSILHTMNLALMFVMLSAFILAVPISWLMTRRISNNLAILCNYADSIGNLDFSQQDYYSEISEFDALYKKMHHMASRLQEYDDNQKRFLLNVSHDLRTPLTSIAGYSESIYYDVTDDAKASALTILKESRRLQHMVEDILFMSRMDMSEDAMVYETMDLVQLIQETLESISVQFQDKGCRIVLNMPEIPILISGDENLTIRAITNIFANALRYVKEEIVVTLTRTEKNERAVLTIADDGPGFEEEELPLLFNRFYKGKKGNFGVGMSILKMVIEKMGGEVCAYNRSDTSGAVVEVVLPILKGDT